MKVPRKNPPRDEALRSPHHPRQRSSREDAPAVGGKKKPVARETTLLVISHTPHYRTDAGLAGWGPTVRELDHLAGLFKRVVHLAPVHEEPAPASSRTYRAGNLRVRPLRPTGGDRLVDKLGILAGAPSFLAALLDEVSRADALHLRAPANVALLALLARRLAPTRSLRSKPWWVKYAGNWRPADEAARREPLSYRLQRAMLRRDEGLGGDGGGGGWAVTVNGRFEADGPHVHAFLNPCLDEKDLERARAAGPKRLEHGRDAGASIRLLFVGQLDRNKGADRAVEVAAGLSVDGSVDGPAPVVLDVAGDGPERPRIEELARRLGADVHFHGWLARPQLDELYRRAHVILLPSLTEGWPKVLSEAMAWGVVPVASAVSAIPSILHDVGVGEAAPARDIAALRGAVRRIVASEEVFARQSRRAAAAAARFSYGHYLDAVRGLFERRFGVELPQNSTTAL